MSAVLQFLDEVPEAAAEHGAGRGAAQQAAKSAGDHIGEAAAGPSAGRQVPGALPFCRRQQAAEQIVESAAGIAGSCRIAEAWAPDGFVRRFL